MERKAGGKSANIWEGEPQSNASTVGQKSLNLVWSKDHGHLKKMKDYKPGLLLKVHTNGRNVLHSSKEEAGNSAENAGSTH